jgi:hypothetical protein
MLEVVLGISGWLGIAHPHGGKVLGSLRKECGYGFVWVQAIEYVGHV